MSLVPAWIIKALAAIGGWNVFDRTVLPLVNKIYQGCVEKRDQPIWEIVRKPKPKVVGMQGGKPLIDRRQEDPYILEEIVARAGRSKGSVRRSLARLEKRGKVKETHDGWIRAQ